jgi:transposase
MTGRGDLTEAEWRRLKPLLPTGNNRCVRWRDHRQVVNGILHRTSIRAHQHAAGARKAFSHW